MIDFAELRKDEQVLLTQALQAGLALTDTFPVMLPLYDDLDETPTPAQCALASEFIRYVLHYKKCPTGWEYVLCNVLRSVHLIWTNLLEDLEEDRIGDLETIYGVNITREMNDKLYYLACSFKWYYLEEDKD